MSSLLSCFSWTWPRLVSYEEISISDVSLTWKTPVEWGQQRGYYIPPNVHLFTPFRWNQFHPCRWVFLSVPFCGISSIPFSSFSQTHVLLSRFNHSLHSPADPPLDPRALCISYLPSLQRKNTQNCPECCNSCLVFTPQSCLLCNPLLINNSSLCFLTFNELHDLVPSLICQGMTWHLFNHSRVHSDARWKNASSQLHDLNFLLLLLMRGTWPHEIINKETIKVPLTSSIIALSHHHHFSSSSPSWSSMPFSGLQVTKKLSWSPLQVLDFRSVAKTCCLMHSWLSELDHRRLQSERRGKSQYFHCSVLVNTCTLPTFDFALFFFNFHLYLGIQ